MFQCTTHNLYVQPKNFLPNSTHEKGNFKIFFDIPMTTPSESVNLSSFLFMLIDENFMRHRTEENISVGRETKIIRVNG